MIDPSKLPDALADERALVGLILAKPALCEVLEEEVAPDDFISPLHAKMLMVAFDGMTENYVVDIRTLMAAMAEVPRDTEVAPGFNLQQYIAHLLANAPYGGDPMQTARDLAARIRSIADAERETGLIHDDVPDDDRLPLVTGFRSAYGGYRFEDIGKNGYGYDWTIENVIPAAQTILTFGDSGTGKTFDTYKMCMCIARGETFNGFNVDGGLVIYIAAEAGDGFAKRKVAYCLHHKISLADQAKIPFYLLTKRINLFGSDIDTDGLIKEIKSICDLYNIPLRLVVIDTLSASTSGANENNSADVGQIKTRIERIRNSVRASVLVIHHKPKGGGTPRGHGSLTADFETTIEYETSEDLREGNLPVHTAKTVKQREGKSGLSWRFTLPVVEVGRNKWSNAETSCVSVPYASAPSGPRAYKPTDAQRVFLGAMFEVLANVGVAPNAAGLPLPKSVNKVAMYEKVREEFAARMPQNDADRETHLGRVRAALHRASSKLVKDKIIGFKAPYVWWAGKEIAGFEGTKKQMAPVYDDDIPLPLDADDFH